MLSVESLPDKVAARLVAIHMMENRYAIGCKVNEPEILFHTKVVICSWFTIVKQEITGNT